MRNQYLTHEAYIHNKKDTTNVKVQFNEHIVHKQKNITNDKVLFDLVQ